MKSIDVLLLGTVAAAILCGTAGARNIQVDGWEPRGPLGTTSSVSVDPANLPLGGPLMGITTLSFAPGTALSEYQAAILDQTEFGNGLHVEYAFGGESGAAPNLITPQEQVVIDTSAPGATSKFSVEFNYAVGFGYTDTFGGPGETASLTVNDITYTANNPGALNDTTGVLTFVNGILQNAADYVGSWTQSPAGGGGTNAAPEIDPASAISALTLLAGGLLILRGGHKRRDVKEVAVS